MSNAQLNSIQFATRQILSEFSMLWVPIALSVGQSARQTMRTGQKTVRPKNQRSREAPSFPASVGLEVSMKLATRISNQARKLPIGGPPSALFSAEFADLSSGRRESRKKHCVVQVFDKNLVFSQPKAVSFAPNAVSLEIGSLEPIFLEISICHVFCHISFATATAFIGDHLANSMSRNGTSLANDNNPGDNENERRQRRYYVVDAGFSNIPGYLTPYKGERLFMEYGDAWADYDEFRNPPQQHGIRVDVDMSSTEMNVEWGLEGSSGWAGAIVKEEGEESGSELEAKSGTQS
ncbi:hypothetical protein CRG98_031431 [Punica granatum]|uniref:Uncharacterized protein n=1 Tax=Punica granatum TaxID=22663 RepID=A0A2I0IXL6_PUNGR|nr:hypothetical protein CRG98_031431 [Punica granatum]